MNVKGAGDYLFEPCNLKPISSSKKPLLFLAIAFITKLMLAKLAIIVGLVASIGRLLIALIDSFYAVGE